MTMKMSISQYYKAFGIVRVILAGLSFVPPLIGLFVSDSGKIPNYFYPPLGDFKIISIVGTVALGLLSTYAVFLYCSRSSRALHPTATLVLSVIAALSLFVLLALYIRLVKVVPIASENTEVTVSIGYDRTQFVSSSRELVNLTDSELLLVRGPWENQIQKLWTLNSIIVARGCLGAFYTCFLVCLVSILSLGVYQEASEEAPRE